MDVSISASPPTARLALDGIALSGNPYAGRLPKDDRPHRVTASAPGFVSEDRALQLRRDVHLELALRAEGAGRPPIKHAASAAPAAGPTPNRTTRPANPIDTRDPYEGGSP